MPIPFVLIFQVGHFMPQYIFAIAKGFRSTPLPINGSGEDQNPLASEDGRNIDNYAFLLNLAIGFFLYAFHCQLYFHINGKKKLRTELQYFQEMERTIRLHGTQLM